MITLASLRYSLPGFYKFCMLIQYDYHSPVDLSCKFDQILLLILGHWLTIHIKQTILYTIEMHYQETHLKLLFLVECQTVRNGEHFYTSFIKTK